MKNVQANYVFVNGLETIKSYGLSAMFAFGILLLVSCYISSALLYYAGGILFLASVLQPTVSRWRPKKRISVEGKAVFISGCDRGFGHMLAQRLDDIGFHVFAGCLFPDGAGAESLRKSRSNRLHVIGLDVTSDSSIQEAVTCVEENLGDNVLWGLVNNAGIGEVAEIPWVSMESVEKTIDVNTFGAVRLTKAFLLKLKESQGRVVTVASMGGRFAVPGIVPYCMSKSAVISFSDGLRLEICKSNVQVITIEPTFYRTPIVNQQEVAKKSLQLWANASKNVKDALYGSKKPVVTMQNAYRYLPYFLREPIEVVSVIEEALTALCPEYSYKPGSSILLFCLWILQTLPKQIVDMIYYVTSEFLSK